MGGNRNNSIAVVLAAILVVSAITTPVLASGIGDSSKEISKSDIATVTTLNDISSSQSKGHGPPGHNRARDPSNVSVPDISTNNSIQSLTLARNRALALADEHDKSASEFERVADLINESITEYRQFDRIDSRAAFDTGIRAQRALSKLGKHSDEGSIESVSKPLFQAYNRSSRIAVIDASHAVAVYESEFRNPGQRQRVESYLGNAADALDRANRAIDKSTRNRGPPTRGKHSIKRRVQALTQLRNAWKHTDKTLDATEANTQSTLALSHKRAFEHNGTVVVPLRVTVRDVRPFEYDGATVNVSRASVDPGSVPLRSPESPATAATGSTLLRFENRTQNVTVVASATSAHDDERSVTVTRTLNLSDIEVLRTSPAPDEYRNVSITDDSSGVTVEASGEGLSSASLRIEDETPASNSSYRAGPMVHIESERPVDNATVHVPITDDVSPESNLSVYTWDPTSAEPWTAVETDIDPNGGIATAEVDHFSYFSVFRVEAWNDTTSDTISLEDEHVEGNLTGNVSTGDPLKAEFAFVIDTSGSMGGERIRYARDAARRFVGALFEDERAGLATFDDHGRLVAGLTTDHAALNRTLSSLGTGGSTNTGGGLQAGIDELTTNGWDNRSKEMLLLADGGTNTGPNPVSVAETAAEHNITVNTVGVGSGIDENELRSIAGATGGDFYHVQSAEDLPETFERVAENRSISLKDSDGDNIPDAVEQMDLRMPTGGPGVVGEPLHLDPFAKDTSGNGIWDNETVDVEYRVVGDDNETKLHAQVTDAKSHPARLDTTGNGLPDREQIEGWEIQYTPDRDHTRTLMEDLADAEDFSELDDLEAYFEIETVTANPLVEDTDGDGLTDLEERQLGTNPSAGDTTSDGISDSRAVSGDADPTLYDITPPELDVYYVAWEKQPWSFDTDYEVQFAAEDPAGLGGATVLRGGDTETNHHLAGRHDSVTSEFTTGAFDTVTDFYSGTSITVEASDRNDNTAKALAIQRHDVFGQVATKLSAEGIVGYEQTKSLGTLSGLSTGGVETAEMLQAMVTDPVGYLKTTAQVVSKLDEMDELIRQLPASVETQQKRNNPHEEGTQAYRAYRQGWYEGYLGYMVLETALPDGKLGIAAKSSSKFQRTVQTLDKAGRLSKAAKYAAKTADTAKAPVRYTGYQLSRGLAATKTIGQQTGRHLLEGAKTTAKQVRWARHTRRMDAETARLAADGGADFRRGVYRAADSDAIDSFDQLDRAVRKIDELDGPPRTRAEILVGKTEGKGLAFVDDVESGTLRKVLDSPDVHIDEVVGAVRKYDRLDAAKRSQFRELLADDGVRDSWVSEIGDRTVSLDNVEDALDRIGRVDIPERQLQSKFKHADDFGVTGNWNSENKEAFQDALTRHIADPETRSIDGTYRDTDVTHLYNSQTGNNVIVSADGEFVSGWELSEDQVKHLLNSGDL